MRQKLLKIKSVGIFLVFCMFLGTIFADTNGVWHDAEDVRVGTFASDEDDGTSLFTFVNPVFINNTLNISADSGRGIYSFSNSSDGVAGVTNTPFRAGVYGWSKNGFGYSGYFEGGNFIVGSGNVGIGVNPTTAKLDVNGNIKALSIYVASSIGIGVPVPSKALEVNGDIKATNIYVSSVSDVNTIKSTAGGNIVIQLG